MNEENEQETGLLNRIKESPRTVSALIIILIVAAAIYAFSGDETQVAEPTQDADVATEEVMDEDVAMEDEDNEGVVAGDVDMDDEMPAQEQPVEVTKDELQAEQEKLPEATQTADGYVEVAQAGDGLTHLARRATTRWLNDNQAGFSVTNEHRIFIEDYIQNNMGSTRLALGDTQTITYDLVADAVAAASELTDGQLVNLSQYTTAL